MDDLRCLGKQSTPHPPDHTLVVQISWGENDDSPLRLTLDARRTRMRRFRCDPKRATTEKAEVT